MAGAACTRLTGRCGLRQSTTAGGEARRVCERGSIRRRRDTPVSAAGAAQRQPCPAGAARGGVSRHAGRQQGPDAAVHEVERDGRAPWLPDRLPERGRRCLGPVAARDRRRHRVLRRAARAAVGRLPHRPGPHLSPRHVERRLFCSSPGEGALDDGRSRRIAFRPARPADAIRRERRAKVPGAHRARHAGLDFLALAGARERREVPPGRSRGEVRGGDRPRPCVGVRHQRADLAVLLRAIRAANHDSRHARGIS